MLFDVADADAQKRIPTDHDRYVGTAFWMSAIKIMDSE
jgi:hypothetical protein